MMKGAAIRDGEGWFSAKDAKQHVDGTPEVEQEGKALIAARAKAARLSDQLSTASSLASFSFDLERMADGSGLPFLVYLCGMLRIGALEEKHRLTAELGIINNNIEALSENLEAA